MLGGEENVDIMVEVDIVVEVDFELPYYKL